METDGLSAEVLYPTYLLPHFAMDDAKLQEACFRAYNDWLIEYCKVSPKRLIGIAAISVYDIDEAVKELERCAKAGMKGSIIWQAPHPDLPFHSEHYNKFWAASQDLNMPVHLHILTGHGYHKETVFGNKRTGVEAYRGSVNLKLKEIIDAFFELIFYGVLERYPKLRFVSVENEIGWMPFMLQQWDYYYNRFKKVNPPPITKNPSEYFKNQIFGTFFRDTVGGPQFRVVGPGQLHVVQRLSARQLDLAGVEKIYRPRPRPLAGRYSQEAGLHQREESLRHGHPASGTGASQFGRPIRTGARDESDSAHFFGISADWFTTRATRGSGLNSSSLLFVSSAYFVVKTSSSHGGNYARTLRFRSRRRSAQSSGHRIRRAQSRARVSAAFTILWSITRAAARPTRR